MRGADSNSESLFTTVQLEELVPASHPLRPTCAWVNEALTKMDERFSAMYEADIKGGRPTIAPEKLMLMRGEAAASALQHPQRMSAHGAGELQPLVPLVRRPVDRLARSGITR